MLLSIDWTNNNTVKANDKNIGIEKVIEAKSQSIVKAINELPERIPEFEKRNHREKSGNTWKIKEEKKVVLWNWRWSIFGIERKQIEQMIKIKTNPEGDIKEYVSWVPAHLIGEQFFKKEAIKRLWLYNRLPANKAMIGKIIKAQPWKRDKDKYAYFYKKYLENKLSGVWSSKDESFHNIDRIVNFLLADDSIEFFCEDVFYGLGDADSDWFFSVRLIKQ